MTPADAELVARLREWAASPGGLTTLATCADRIEALSAANDRKNAALRKISGGGYLSPIHVQRIANEAMEGST